VVITLASVVKLPGFFVIYRTWLKPAEK
jgi:hypothetical protein